MSENLLSSTKSHRNEIEKQPNRNPPHLHSGCNLKIEKARDLSLDYKSPDTGRERREGNCPDAYKSPGSAGAFWVGDCEWI
ncbi:hypothetical protein NPIL_598601 [Nephila pilipes]|uniref:Uncharacterized protein n=1 Tax=Nephila pilipes TaxID=299642 RepID=A0A8X6P6I6_NEPPI|nr:hypothetical protein NPIL_598601 [Nephila pilipes]